jgi:hypothetical protein
MRGRTLLTGTESCSVEIAGRLAPERARHLVGPGLPLRENARGAEIEMLAFRMAGLAPKGVPWIGMAYGEVLFRLGVEWRGAPAWLAVRCALDRAPVAALAAALIRYPITRVRRISVEPGPGAWCLSTEDHRGTVLRAMLELAAGSPPPAEVRPVLVRDGTRLLRVPWDETPAPRRLCARVAVEPGALEREAFGAHACWESAVVHEGRVHRCGVAGPV